MSIKKSIGWTDMTLNPIKGRCLGNCRLPDGTAYCYYSGERGIIKRFQQEEGIRNTYSVFDRLPKTPKRIFLCSTHDLFGSWIPKRWRDEIFLNVEEYPQHTFQILTKFPQNIDREMPNNVWLGVTVTNEGDLIKTWRLGRKNARLHFVSIEPMLEYINPRSLYYKHTNWIIIGQLTGFGKKYNPKREWIDEWVRCAKWHNIPIFLKDNLKEIWGEKLIQEMPE